MTEFSPSESEASPGPTLPERLLALATSPARAFRPPLPRSTWVVPLVILLVVQVGHAFFLRDLYLDMQRDRIEESERIPAEQKQAILDGLDKAPASPALQILTAAGSTVAGWAIQFLLPALLYLLGLNFVLGAQLRFRDIFAVTVLSAVVYAVREVIRTPIIAAQGTVHVYTGPAALAAGGDRRLVYGLQMFDLFELYRLYLLTVGFAVVSGLPARRTAFPVVVVWLLFGLVGLGCVMSPLGEFMP